MARPSEDNLTKSFAEARRKQVEKISYEMFFDLKKGSETYMGRTKMNVSLTQTRDDLSIDYLGKKLDSVIVNGVEIKKFPTRTGSFDIPAKYLKKENQIEISYTNEFNKDGEGFSKSVDPEDSAEYHFTDFEPFGAHRLFPCLDQPDLRATYKITVQAPKDWKIVTNTLPVGSSAEGDTMITVFETTKSFSTYLVFLGAGPFAEWKDQLGDLPLYLYSRKSLARFVDAERIFEVTKKGLDFYSRYFDYKYPFQKYGHIYIPEFASSGMENPGAIALDERFIFRGPVSESRMADRDDLILHEMAHMWFGDLVTMNWWDDLWLNESFATYMSSLSLDRAMKLKSTWGEFFKSKGWGYWQDQLVTTHPIETLVPDVETGKGNFDGITYAKGAATLKQLHFYVGEENFKKGIQNYFKTFAFKNTSRKDFIDAIAATSKKDLNPWIQAWLQTAGPHRIQTQWDCKDGKIQSFSLIQKENASKKLSPHRTKIGLFKRQGDKPFELIQTQEFSFDQAENKVLELVGKSCPDFVYANLDDQDYALYSLDSTSLKAAKEALTGAIQDPLLRIMIWSSLAQMVRDTELSVREYYDFALAGLENEADPGNLGILTDRFYPLRSYYYSYLTPSQRKELAPRLEKLVEHRLSIATPESSLQMTFFDFFVSIAQSPEALARLAQFLNNENLPKGLKLDQDRRWALILQLATNGHSGIKEIIENEKKKDPSTAGARFAYAAERAVPDMKVKSQFWSDLQNNKKIPYSNLRMAAGRFHSSNYPPITESFKSKFFERVSHINWKTNDNLIDIYFDGLFPRTLCTPKVLKESQSKMERAKNLTSLAKRAWLEANDELSKCVSVRKKSQMDSVKL